jgi:transketolase
MRNAVVDTIEAAAAADPDLWLLTADLGYSVLERFASRFPDRYINVGVAEQNMMGVAAGLALSGKRVVAYSIANFATLRCLEQIRNDIVHHRADVKVVAVGGGFAYGPQGHTHQGIEDLATMLTMPGLDVVAPADPYEASLAAKAMLERRGPTYLRLARAGEPRIHSGTPPIERGKHVECRSGTEVLLIACGPVLAEAVGAADLVRSEGVSCAVWSMPWLNPVDTAAVVAATRTYTVIMTVEEGTANGGLGSRISRLIAEASGLRARHVVAAVENAPENTTLSEQGARRLLRLDAEGLASRIRDAVARA